MTDKEAISELEEFRNFKHTYYGNAWTKVEVCADDEMKGKIDKIINLIKTQQKEIEKLKKQSKLTAEEHEKVFNEFEKKIEKKDTLIHTMQAEFERLEDLEDNTDMLKLELQKKDKIINEMAIALYDEWYMPSLNTVEKIKEYFLNEVEKER